MRILVSKPYGLGDMVDDQAGKVLWDVECQSAAPASDSFAGGGNPQVVLTTAGGNDD